MPDFVERDHQLEAAHERTGHALAEHRWRWTLDDTNPGAMEVGEYAAAVGRAYSGIYSMAHGWATFVAQGGVSTRADTGISLSDCIVRASMSAEKAMAVEAVARHRDVTMKTAAAHYGGEVRDVLDSARDRVVRHGVPLPEAVESVASLRATARKSEQARQDARPKSPQLFRYNEVAGMIADARRNLRKAARAAQGIEWQDDWREILEDDLQHLRNSVDLLALVITNDGAEIDWDAALTRLGDDE